MASVKDFGAKGDGKTDDTKSIQSAVSKHLGTYRFLYFPRGTYRISSPIQWKFDTTVALCKEADRCWSNGLTLIGQDRGLTVIRLYDSLPAFGSKGNPKGAFITASGPFSATSIGDDGSINNGFGNGIENLTIDVGMGNPGAVGIDYLANNVGAIRNVTILSKDKGFAGILMTRNSIGPCLIKDVAITGFDYAMKAANVRSSFTLENVSIKDQAIAGIATCGNNFSVKGLLSENAVVALVETTPTGNVGPIPGFMVLIDSKLIKGSAESAIKTPANLFLRNVLTEGYYNALEAGSKTVPGGKIKEYQTGSRKSLWQRAARITSLNLLSADTPIYWDNVSSHWAVVPAPSTPSANRVNIAAAMASGKTTIFFRPGRYDLDGTITVTGKVRHILGNGTFINPVSVFGDSTHPKPLIRVDHDSPSLTIRFLILGDWNKSHPGLICVEHASRHRLVLQDVLMWDEDMHSAYRALPGAGEMFLENVSNQVSTGWRFAKGQTIWARQLNLEGRKTKIFNDGATVWIFGMKTESTGTIIDNRNHGSAELLGGYFLNWNADFAPAFINDNANLSASYFSEANSPEFGYSIHVSEKRGEIERRLTKDDVIGNIYRCAVPLYTGYEPDPADSINTRFE